MLPINAESAFMYAAHNEAHAGKLCFGTWVIHKHLKYTVLVWNARYLLANNQPLIQRTELTSGTSVYPYIEALCDSTGVRYVTVEDSCCGTLRVAVENHSSRKGSFSSSVW